MIIMMTSRTGHVCLLLLPVLEVPHNNDQTPNDAIHEEIQRFRDGGFVASARERILAILPVSSSFGSR